MDDNDLNAIHDLMEMLGYKYEFTYSSIMGKSFYEFEWTHIGDSGRVTKTSLGGFKRNNTFFLSALLALSLLDPQDSSRQEQSLDSNYPQVSS